MAAQTPHILTINTGSSSVKLALYQLNDAEPPVLTATAERIGAPDGHLRVSDAQGARLLDERAAFPSHDRALQRFFEWLHQHKPDQRVAAVGHRVVHGGSQYSRPQLVTDELIAALQRLVPIDPDHLPQAISAMQTVSRVYPAIPQIACFDTAFHHAMPPVAQMVPLPRRLWEEGVRRYGFHGLSYEYILAELRRIDPAAAEGRLIIAHLGNGASMAAVRAGQSIDTTMGFTPTGGLVMGTRTGDLDPGVLLYLLQAKGMTPTAVSDLVNKQAGLVGVSGSSGDMRDLLQKRADDPHAGEAVDLFCYQARKFLGALAAALGGLDTLIFTGGIGEHAAPVRQGICADLEFLGIQLDPQRNEAHASVISADGSPITVRVIRTDEERMIAHHVYRLMAEQGETHVPL